MLGDVLDLMVVWTMYMKTASRHACLLFKQ